MTLVFEWPFLSHFDARDGFSFIRMIFDLGIIAAPPQFSIKETPSGIPDVKVTFEDGQSDSLVLDNYLFDGNNSAQANSCSYLGNI